MAPQNSRARLRAQMTSGPGPDPAWVDSISTHASTLGLTPFPPPGRTLAP
jgi:hypothetical protein